LIDDKSLSQQSVVSSVFLHIFTGFLVLLFQFITVNFFIDRGYPPYLSGLAGFVLVSIPIQIIIIRRASKFDNLSIKDLLGNPIKKKIKIIIPVIITFYIYAIIISPINTWMQQEVFFWTPKWLLEPVLLQSIPSERILIVFILTLFIDGLVNPFVEELYWRGFLLKSISRYGLAAPVLNGLLFGVQHFWQPFNYVLIVPYSILLSYLVWSKNDLRLSIFIHCSINCIGALITFIPLLLG